MKESSQYEKIVNWYNTILDRASKARERAGDLTKEADINEVLTNSLESLWKSVDPSYLIDGATKREIVNISHRMNKEGVDKFRRKGQKGELVHNFIQGIKSIFGKSPSAFFEAQFIAASKIRPIDINALVTTIPAVVPAPAVIIAQQAAAPRAVVAPAPVAAQPVPVDPRNERMRRLAAAAGNSAAKQGVMGLTLNAKESAAVRSLQQGGDGKGLSKASQGAWASRRGENARG